MPRPQAVFLAVLPACAVAVLLLGRPPLSATSAGPAPAEADKAGPQWERPRFPAHQVDRDEMVRRYVIPHGVTDTAVLAAMRNVPRHDFVPDARAGEAYEDYPLPIGHGQTISQPSLVAYMTELLGLKPGQKVLEIGTGSGYQAALLAELTPHVFTIEIIRALGLEAQKRLARLGYKTVQCKVADGYTGWPEEGPFDAIIVTCAAGTVPPPLVKQLKPGGRMCIPVGPPGSTQYLVLVTKDAEGKVRSKSLTPVVFVPLTRNIQ